MTATLPTWIVSAEGQIVASRGKPKKRSPSSRVLVADLKSFIRQYVVMADEKVLVVALWIIYTHCFEEFEQTPYLAITSPEKQLSRPFDK